MMSQIGAWGFAFTVAAGVVFESSDSSANGTSPEERPSRQPYQEEPSSRCAATDPRGTASEPSRGAAVNGAAEGGIYRTPYRHDGPYLLLDIGFAYFSQTSESNEGGPTTSFSGWGPAYDLRFGGTTHGGFSLGFGMGGFRVSGVKEIEPVSEPQYSEERVAELFHFGPFVDWFVVPTGGFHVGLMIGFHLEGGGDPSVWIGQQFWISKGLSIGPEVRYVLLFNPTAPTTAWELVLVGLYN
jgi:hypothetical protein